MEKIRIIHKNMRSYYQMMKETLCGKVRDYIETSYQWKKVNCKECLKRRK
jgi:hypothetical protein